MSAPKILLGFFSLAIILILIGNKAPVQALTASRATATLLATNNSAKLNTLLNANGFNVGYNLDLEIQPPAETYTAKNGVKFVVARGRRCSKMVPFA